MNTCFIPTRADDKEMIEHPERWPLGPLLPVKNRKKPTEDGWPLLGIIWSDDPTYVYVGILGLTDYETCPKERYADVDALLDAGWVVD